MRARPARHFRIYQSLADRAEALAEATGYGSANRVIEQCVQDMFLLCDTPREEREFPVFLRVVDGLRVRGRFAAVARPDPSTASAAPAPSHPAAALNEPPPRPVSSADRAVAGVRYRVRAALPRGKPLTVPAQPGQQPGQRSQ